MLRPKNRKRCSANAMRVPSTSATAVDASATSTLVSTASRAPALWNARTHHSVVKPSGGHVIDGSGLKEFATTTSSGAYMSTSTRAVTASRARREVGLRVTARS